MLSAVSFKAVMHRLRVVQQANGKFHLLHVMDSKVVLEVVISKQQQPNSVRRRNLTGTGKSEEQGSAQAPARRQTPMCDVDWRQLKRGNGGGRGSAHRGVHSDYLCVVSEKSICICKGARI